MCVLPALSAVTAHVAREPAAARHELGSGTLHTPRAPRVPRTNCGMRAFRPDPDPWWTRHRRDVLAGSVVLAALVVMVWPGSLLVLGFGTLGAGILAVACVALIQRVAARRSIRGPGSHG